MRAPSVLFRELSGLSGSVCVCVVRQIASTSRAELQLARKQTHTHRWRESKRRSCSRHHTIQVASCLQAPIGTRANNARATLDAQPLLLALLVFSFSKKRRKKESILSERAGDACYFSSQYIYICVSGAFISLNGILTVRKVALRSRSRRAFLVALLGPRSQQQRWQ